jgi:membrane protein implicated in regulation of membrane protease activity
MILTDTLSLWWFWLIIWGCILIIAVIVEAITEELVSIWFALGAFIAALLACFGVVWYVQLIIFVLVSILTIILVRAVLIRDRRLHSLVATNTDSLVGEEIVVTKKIDGIHNPGEGKYRDVIWTLESEDTFEPCEKAIVSEIKGNKLVVTKKN